MKTERNLMGTTSSPPLEMGVLTPRSRKLLDRIIQTKEVSTEQIANFVPKERMKGILFTTTLVAITEFFNKQGVSIKYSSQNNILLRIAHLKPLTTVTEPKNKVVTVKPVRQLKGVSSLESEEEEPREELQGPKLDELGEYNFVEEKVDFSIEKFYFESVWYFESTMKHTVYDKAYTYALIEKAQSNDLNARNLLITHNQRLILYFAKRYKGRLLEAETLQYIDLIQEGTFGLYRAIEKFDLSLGLSFSTYAGWWIRQTIGRAVMNYQLVIYVPVHMHERLNQFRKIRSAFELRDGYASIGAIADFLGITIEDAYRLERVHNQSSTSSLDQTIGDDDDEEDQTLVKFLADDQAVSPSAIADSNITQENICNRLKIILSPKEYKIIESRFGLGDKPQLKLREIGEKFGVTRERIRQIEERALERLETDALIKKLGKEYFDKSV